MSKLYRFDTAGRYLGFIAVDRPIEEYAARTDVTEMEPPQAQAGYWRHWTGAAWEQVADSAAPGPTLEQLKAQKWVEMKEARRQALCAPLATPYGTFDADPDSRGNIIDTAHLMQTEAQAFAPGSNPTEDFTLADNTVVTLTASQMVEVALLLANQVKAAYARGRVVRAEIEAATTAAEVAAVTWSTP